MAPLLAARRAQAASDRPGFGRAKACIVLWMTGGPPQHETWDPKPDAPAEIRGPFVSINTNLPAVRVGALMPRTPQILTPPPLLPPLPPDHPSHPCNTPP